MKKRLLNCLFSFAALAAISTTSPLLSAEQDHDFYGRHLIFSLKECDVDALNDIDTLKETFMEAIRASGATCLGVCDYRFDPHGFTLIALLSESHASIHTYPEYGACFVDVFTCGTDCKNEMFEKVLTEYLKPGKSDRTYLERT